MNQSIALLSIVRAFWICLFFFCISVESEAVKSGKPVPRVPSTKMTVKQRLSIQRVKLAKTRHGFTIQGFLQEFIRRYNLQMAPNQHIRTHDLYWSANCQKSHCLVFLRIHTRGQNPSWVKATWRVGRLIVPLNYTARGLMQSLDKREVKQPTTRKAQKKLNQKVHSKAAALPSKKIKRHPSTKRAKAKPTSRPFRNTPPRSTSRPAQSTKSRK